MSPLRVLHPITHLVVGGASENTITTCRYADPDRFESAILSGIPCGKEADLVDHARELGVPVHLSPTLKRDIHPADDVRAYRDLARWMRKTGWDIVHTHSSKAGILGRLAAKRAGVKVIVHTVHGWGHHDHMNPAKRSLLVALERTAARCSHRIIAVSKSCRDRGLREKIGTPEQYEVIHSGIDLERYRTVSVDVLSLKSELGIPLDAPVVGTVSRMAPQKAPEDFITVAAKVRQHVPNVRFIFVGGGPDEAAFMEGVREGGLEKTVISLGYRADIPALLRVMDIFLLTSLWEGLPRVFPQAMCASLPIVATHVDGAPEAIQDGKSGFLVQPRDCDAMARHVIRLLGNKSLRDTLGEAGYCRVEPAFCDRNMVRSIEAVYDSCIMSNYTERSPVGSFQ
jgi:glycosyltransferase involved in cell wall biosynthesis